MSETKKNEIPELNLDEMEKASGGTQTVNMNGREVTREQFDNMFLITSDLGIDIAIGMFKQYCGGFDCREMHPGFSWSCHYPSNRDKMGVILHKYWQYVETGKVY